VTVEDILTEQIFKVKFIKKFFFKKQNFDFFRILSRSKLCLAIEDVTKPHFIYQCVAILRVILASERSDFLRIQMAKLMTHNDVRCVTHVDDVVVVVDVAVAVVVVDDVDC
jgi:hypothetical protein